MFAEKLIDFINSTKIRNTTISEAGAALERYQVTTVDRKYSNNRLELNVSGLVDEVFYFLKTNGKDVKSARGCTFEEIAEGYYLLRINNNFVEIETNSSKSNSPFIFQSVHSFPFGYRISLYKSSPLCFLIISS